MDRDMYLNRATLKNIDVLKKRSIHILDVEDGELALIVNMFFIFGLVSLHFFIIKLEIFDLLHGKRPCYAL